MIKSNSDLIKGINRHLKTSKKNSFSANGVTINLTEKDGKYLGCKIGRRPYWLLFQDVRTNRPGKCFIHLYDDNKDKPSVVQFTIDNSNFQIDQNDFYIIQNRGTTIGKRIDGFEAEFKALMVKNGFNKDSIVTQGDCKKPDYDDILSQLLLWLRLRVITKLQLEDKYRNIEDRTSEDESELDFEDVRDIESRTEGGKKVVISVRTERDSKFRADAIKIHGLVCKACGFDFQKTYGNWGKDFIEVHHVVPLADGKKRETNPKTDLTVVCSNCHRMIHRKKNITLTIDELKTKLKTTKNISS
jgi:5-methylcytosine-specific restriction endonuclease McrA